MEESLEHIRESAETRMRKNAFMLHNYIELERVEHQVPESIALQDDTLVPFLGGETVHWSVKS